MGARLTGRRSPLLPFLFPASSPRAAGGLPSGAPWEDAGLPSEEVAAAATGADPLLEEDLLPAEDSEEDAAGLLLPGAGLPSAGLLRVVLLLGAVADLVLPAAALSLRGAGLPPEARP